MKKCFYILVVLMIAATSAMAQQRPTTQPAPTRTIVKVVSRDTTIVASSGPNGLVYSLEGKNGQVIVPNMSLPDMQAKHPELARHIRTMNASAREISAYAGVE